MGICPVCNGLEQPIYQCQQCGSTLEESGRLMDYFDDYSAYMPIDLMKLEDGIRNDARNEQCPHVYHCPSCHHDQIMIIKE